MVRDDLPLTPTEYPADVHDEVDTGDLWHLYDRFRDDEDKFAEYHEEWPPTDALGNVFPIFFTPEELNDRGFLRDYNSREYRPFAGNLEIRVGAPDEKFCNATLTCWDDRYPQIRYCGRGVPDVDHLTFCHVHRGKEQIMETAEEAMQTGLWARSIDHYYTKLDPLKKLFGWGTFESLMGESVHQFAPEYEPREFDFSEADIDERFWPKGVNEDGLLEVRCAYPTEHGDRAVALYVAAMMSVQMISVQPRIMYEDREAGEGMMESRTIEHAQLTAPPSEHDPTDQEFKTLETWSEHHLNLPLSRLVTDRPKLLEYGGVTSDAEDTGSVSDEEIVMEIQADVDDESVTTEMKDGSQDPNFLGSDETEYMSESEMIVSEDGRPDTD